MNTTPVKLAFPDGVSREVPAIVFGDFAAHQPHRYSQLADAATPVENAGWVVSHIPCGLGVVSALRAQGVLKLNKNDAVAWARAAEFVCRSKGIDTAKINEKSSNEQKREMMEALQLAWNTRQLL